MSDKHAVCPVEELQPGERKIVEVAERSIGVFNIDGDFFAIKNLCPHHFAPLCEGQITGTMQPADEVGEYNWLSEGKIIRCPWHKWEFDIRTGESVYNPHKLRTRSYETSVETSACSPDTNGESTTCGDDPPVDTYKTQVEKDMVIVYV